MRVPHSGLQGNRNPVSPSGVGFPSSFPPFQESSMSFRSRILTAAFFALISLPMSAAAQDAAPAKLVTGTWTGIVMPPDGTLEVTYDVSYTGDTLAIVLNAGNHGKFTLNELEHTAT